MRPSILAAIAILISPTLSVAGESKTTIRWGTTWGSTSAAAHLLRDTGYALRGLTDVQGLPVGVWIDASRASTPVEISGVPQGGLILVAQGRAIQMTAEVSPEGGTTSFWVKSGTSVYPEFDAFVQVPFVKDDGERVSAAGFVPVPFVQEPDDGRTRALGALLGGTGLTFDLVGAPVDPRYSFSVSGSERSLGVIVVDLGGRVSAHFHGALIGASRLGGEFTGLLMADVNYD